MRLELDGIVVPCAGFTWQSQVTYTSSAWRAGKT